MPILHPSDDDDAEEQLRALGSALVTREAEDDGPEPPARDDVLDTNLDLHVDQIHDDDAPPIARPAPKAEDEVHERLVARTPKDLPRFNTLEILPPYRFSV